MTIKVLCVTADIVLSPKVEDRFCRFRFIPAGDPVVAKGTASTDSSIWINGDAGDYVIGKHYEISLTVKEA